MFESARQVMFASLRYEQLPPFCSHCRIVGHNLDSCRVVPRKSTKMEKMNNLVPAPNHPAQEVWVHKDGNGDKEELLNNQKSEADMIVGNADVVQEFTHANGFALLAELE